MLAETDGVERLSLPQKGEEVSRTRIGEPLRVVGLVEGGGVRSSSWQSPSRRDQRHQQRLRPWTTPFMGNRYD